MYALQTVTAILRIKFALLTPPAYRSSASPFLVGTGAFANEGSDNTGTWYCSSIYEQ